MLPQEVVGEGGLVTHRLWWAVDDAQHAVLVATGMLALNVSSYHAQPPDICSRIDCSYSPQKANFFKRREWLRVTDGRKR